MKRVNQRKYESRCHADAFLPVSSTKTEGNLFCLVEKREFTLIILLHAYQEAKSKHGFLFNIKCIKKLNK